MTTRLLFPIICTLLLQQGLLQQSHGDTALYVNDVLHILLRSGPDTQNQILHKGLVSGTQLEVIAEESENGFTQVKVVGRELEGWVLSQYLVDHPPAKERLKQAHKELATLNNKQKILQTELNTLTKEHKKLRQEHNSLKKENSTLHGELENVLLISADVLSINEKNKVLAAENQSTFKDLELLTNELTKLKDKTNLEWFIAGAGAIFAGILLGLLLPMFKHNKKHSEWA